MSTKDTVLELFEKNRGFFVSGERIASDLGISRTAVWKAVKKLRSEGYEIEAVTNRGYCLANNSDILSVQGIRNHLDEDARQLRPEVFVTVDSTNNVCMKKAANGEDEGYTAIAGAQTMGRGRRGRGFFSPADTGIYMSIILKPAAYPVLKGQEKVYQAVPKPEKEKEPAAPELFDHLRHLRKEIATREHVPPYVVFSDATLRDMCKVLPENLDQMLDVKGIGEMKLHKYGQEFLACITKNK